MRGGTQCNGIQIEEVLNKLCHTFELVGISIRSCRMWEIEMINFLYLPPPKICYLGDKLIKNFSPDTNKFFSLMANHMNNTGVNIFTFREF